jgi:hypothetical protein
VRGARAALALAGWLTLAVAFAQADGRDPDGRQEAPPAVGGGAVAADVLAADRVGDDGAAWLRRMLASERAFAFATAPVERSTWPATTAAPVGGFAWPAGATLEAVRANFDVRWVGRERLADRPAVVIDLVPRHAGPGWRFWIDVATGARVAYRATLGDGRVVAEGRGDAASLGPAGSEGSLPAPRAPSDARAAVWRVAFGGLDGFEPVAVARVRLGAQVPALRVTLWDGLSGVVLLVYPATRDLPRGELIVARTSGDLTLALVGPLPEAVAEAYLEALAARRWARADLEALQRLWAPDDGGGAGGVRDDRAP